MKQVFGVSSIALLLLITSAAWSDETKVDVKDYKDKIQGEWHASKGSFVDKHYFLVLKKYEAYKPGTAGDITIFRPNPPLVQGGKKLPPTSQLLVSGSYGIDGTKLTIKAPVRSGPVDKDNVIWEVIKVTDDSLIVKTDKGDTQEFTKKKK
jgi:hypothetical protein